MINKQVDAMKTFKFTPALTLLVVAVLIGVVVYLFTGFNWLTAGLIFLFAVMINGLAIFSEDSQVGGLDYKEGITDTVESIKMQKRAKQIQGIIICLLFILAILSYVFDWGVA